MLEVALDAPATRANGEASRVALAVACVDALVSFVVREDLEREDFRRSSLRTCSLMAMDRAILRHMLQESETFWRFFGAPRGGLVSLHTKAPGDLMVVVEGCAAGCLVRPSVCQHRLGARPSSAPSIERRSSYSGEALH